MFAVMQELVRQKYPRMIYPGTPAGVGRRSRPAAFKSQYPGGGAYAGYVFNVGYARAMLQAAQQTNK